MHDKDLVNSNHDTFIKIPGDNSSNNNLRRHSHSPSKMSHSMSEKIKLTVTTPKTDDDDEDDDVISPVPYISKQISTTVQEALKRRASIQPSHHLSVESGHSSASSAYQSASLTRIEAFRLARNISEITNNPEKAAKTLGSRWASKTRARMKLESPERNLNVATNSPKFTRTTVGDPLTFSVKSTGNNEKERDDEEDDISYTSQDGFLENSQQKPKNTKNYVQKSKIPSSRLTTDVSSLRPYNNTTGTSNVTSIGASRSHNDLNFDFNESQKILEHLRREKKMVVNVAATIGRPLFKTEFLAKDSYHDSNYSTVSSPSHSRRESFYKKPENKKKQKKTNNHDRILKNEVRTGPKIGKPQLKFSHIENQALITAKDLFNEIMSYSTPALLFLLLAGIVSLWMIFATLYYFTNMAIMNKSGLFGNNGNPRDQCISFEANFTFVNAFLFSLESQTTIGYGGRHPEDRFLECWPIIIIQCIQPIVALATEGMLVVIIFTRLTDARYTKIRYFLKKCCIFERNGSLNLVIRSGIDSGQPDLVGVAITGKLLKTRHTIEGDKINLEERDIFFPQCDLISTQIPVDLCHPINNESPLYELGKDIIDHDGEQLEIVMTLTATIESTGAIYQSTQSYVTQDILWGYRFEQCMFQTKNEYVVEEEKVNKWYKVEMSDDSQEMRDFHECQRIREEEEEEHENEIRMLEQQLQHQKQLQNQMHNQGMANNTNFHPSHSYQNMEPILQQ